MVFLDKSVSVRMLALNGYSADQKNVVKGCMIKTATPPSFDHVFWPPEYFFGFLCLISSWVPPSWGSAQLIKSLFMDPVNSSECVNDDNGASNHCRIYSLMFRMETHPISKVLIKFEQTIKPSGHCFFFRERDSFLYGHFPLSRTVRWSSDFLRF